jgi:hypothetical protein
MLTLGRPILIIVPFSPSGESSPKISITFLEELPKSVIKGLLSSSTPMIYVSGRRVRKALSTSNLVHLRQKKKHFTVPRIVDRIS